MFTETNESKTLQKIYHDNVNVDLMEEIFIQINGGITINVNVSVKKMMYVKRILFGIQVNVFVRIENIQQLLWIKLSVIKLQA